MVKIFTSIELISRVLPRHLFLIFSGIFGLVYLLLVPPMQHPDERWHFLRAFEISEGTFFHHSESYSVPRQVVSLAELLEGNLPFHPERKTTRKQLNHILGQTIVLTDREAHPEWGLIGRYAPWLYFPQIVGMKIGYLFSPSGTGLIYGGYFAAWLFFVGVGYALIGVAPILQWPLALVLLLPSNVSLCISFSSDGAGILLSGLFILTVVKIILDSKQRQINTYQVLGLGSLSVVVSLFKYVYAPLVGLLFLIPKTKLAGKKRQLSLILILLAVSGSIYWWHRMSAPFVLYRFEGVNNFQFITEHPLKYLGMFILNGINQTWEMLAQAVACFGHLDTRIRRFNAAFFLGIILFSIGCYSEASKEGGPKITAKLSIASILVFLLCSLLVFTAMFITWSDFRTGRIEGVQGRYFLPIDFLLVIGVAPSLAWVRRAICRKSVNPAQSLLVAQVHALIQCLGLILVHYWSFKAIYQRFY